MSDTDNRVTMAEVRGLSEGRYIANLADFPAPNDFVLHVTARVFGQLAMVAGPIVEHYHSDLFHDAKQLEALVAGWDRRDTLTFYWSVNDCGTAMSTDKDFPGREIAFVCTLSVDSRNNIVFTMTRR